MTSLIFALADLGNELKKQYRRFPAKNSSLDLDFINNRGRVAGVDGGAFDRITFSRGTTGTYFDAAGSLLSAALNTPRIEFDNVTQRSLGFLVEHGVTNILLNSLLNGTNLSTQSVTVTATPYTLSFFGTGTVTLSGVYIGSSVGVGEKTKKTFTFTPTAGTLTLTVTGTVKWAQLETGTCDTSFIPTAGSPVSRSADIAQMTGTAFTDWWNADEGTFIVSYDVKLPQSISNAGVICAQDGSSINNAMQMWHTTNANTPRVSIYTASSFIFGSTGLSIAANNPTCSVLAYKNNDFASSITNTLQTGSSGAVPVVNTLNIGRERGVSYLNGHIRRITYVPNRLANNILTVLSR